MAMESLNVTRRIKQMVAANAPIVYLYEDPDDSSRKEQYLPSRFEWYLSEVYLHSRDGHKDGPPVAQGQLPRGEEAGQGTYLGYAWGDDSIERGNLPQGDPAQVDVPAYVHVVEKKGGYHIQYWFFYAFNGPGEVRIKSLADDKEMYISLAPGGDHQGDWEHVTVFVDTEGNFEKLYCAQHSSGEFYLKDEVAFEGTSPVVYSAYNGHPSYPSVGNFPNPGGKELKIGDVLEVELINRTGRGLRWDCSEHHEIVAINKQAGPQWIEYFGRAGAVNPNKAVAAELAQQIEAELAPWKGPFAELLKELAEPIAMCLVDVMNGFDNFDGPTMPVAKTEWMSPSSNP